ncbi:MAG: ArsA family ATPase [Desulfovermiculus sp.]|nr:ArsA family ATPase [Desulfovermiculus sp.]
MKILFFSGKGGVGKSTMAAASARQLSRKGRVLIISLDPAHNLGDIFGVVNKGKKDKLTDSLFLQEVDLHKLSREYLQKEINVLTSTYSYLKTFNLDSYFSTLKYSPGIEEYALLTSIATTISRETSFDYIIFDTPPTGLTLRFLALPRVSMTWIDRLIDIRRRILEKRYTIHRIRGSFSSEETVLAYEEKDDDILRRLWTLKETYQDLDQNLRSKDCHVVLVFNPDVLSCKESERLVAGLKELGLPLRLLIDNKVSAENEDQAATVEEKMQALAPGVELKRIRLRKDLGGEEKGGRLDDIQEQILPEAW